MNGIYVYYDNKIKRVIYVGKDGDISNNTRHKQHSIHISRKYEQHINTILHNDTVGRYEYAILCMGNFTNEELDEMEYEAIKLFGTYRPSTGFGWNFTRGGDGIDSQTLAERWHSKEYRAKHGLDKYRVIANGKNYWGIVSPEDSQVFLKRSNDKELLESIVKKLNEGELTKEEVLKLKRDYSLMNVYHVRKVGKNSYSLFSPGIKHPLKTSKDKEKLESLAIQLNDGIITEEYVKSLRANALNHVYRVTSAGLNGHSIIPPHAGKSLKSCINKSILDCLVDMLNNNEITESMVRDKIWYNRFKKNFNNGIYVFFGI